MQFILWLLVVRAETIFWCGQTDSEVYFCSSWSASDVALLPGRAADTGDIDEKTRKASQQSYHSAEQGCTRAVEMSIRRAASG